MVGALTIVFFLQPAPLGRQHCAHVSRGRNPERTVDAPADPGTRACDPGQVHFLFGTICLLRLRYDVVLSRPTRD